jgi:tetratricopeptide (TPR) repeat protein
MKWLKEKFNDFRNKKNPDYWVDKVQDNQEKAIKYYNKALNIYQKNSEGNSEKIAEIHFKKGEIHLENKTHGDAITSFNKALEIYKHNPDKLRDCHFYIGLAYSNSYQYSEALKSFTSALNEGVEDSFSAKINFEIGRVYLRQKLESEGDFKKNSRFYDSFKGDKTKLEKEYISNRATFNEKIIESFQKILHNENNSINPQTLLEINYATAEAFHQNDNKVLAKEYYKKSLEILDLPENSSLYDNRTRSHIGKKLLTLNQVLEAERVNESRRSRLQPPAPVLTQPLPQPQPQPQPPPPAPPPAPAQPQTHPIIVAITSFFDLCSCSQKR